MRSEILKLVGEYGTGSDTLRCLALATHDSPTPLAEMNLQVSNHESRTKSNNWFRIILNSWSTNRA